MRYVVLAFLLSGCAAQVVSSNARSVVIGGDYRFYGGTAAAQKLADAECAKHKRFAKMVGRPNDSSTEYVFDCVE